VANHQAAEAADPGDGAFDFQAPPVATQFSAVLRLRPRPPSTIGTDQVPTFGCQAAPQGIAVVSLVGDQRRRFIADRDVFEDSLDQRDRSRRSTFAPACQWNSLTICHHQPLCTLSALGFADSVAPFFPGEKLASTNTSSQSNSRCSSRESRKACQIFPSTPSPSHSLRRRQQILGEDIAPADPSTEHRCAAPIRCLPGGGGQSLLAEMNSTSTVSPGRPVATGSKRRRRMVPRYVGESARRTS